ncbi:MAG: inorganic phosphate transporter [Candidatus Margulisiibacteriota bacterium]|nr:MAG: hypothetical protein A2X43_06140 [Candidatus Margulisbacteria bacterium GWD2_39_127]OGI01403.1 MAG: hypothetical protein A2X42_12965 [Candidatus Margulisbacteria bacterium GWF2_38_17]OGI10321.1 MAG: hypothetical protein A2X41_12950 [Candidatus Margulisbacteria bacterium GWE2_39_32]PZM84966.1 MAG: inorganic phosphate transporter [Candidatus Margulisiibacteriota bacterium]HAR62014.1 inorganic phosphate transporter [Candidatus Margulisiibacteriota bacterium]
MYWLISALFLGWAMGTNDAANVFGNAVSSRMLTFRRATILAAVFVILGAVLRGDNGIETLSSLSSQTIKTAALVSISAAITVTLMSIIKMPISTSQSVVGAIIGHSLITGDLNTQVLTKVVLGWIGTPIGAFFLAIALYYIIRYFVEKYNYNFIYLDGWIRFGFIIIGCYGSYALGANNVANAVGIYKGLIPQLNDYSLALIGGISIALGILTFSKPVMLTVGKNLVEMNSITSLVAVLTCALTVHFYAIIGVPVSSSQAIIGAVLGMGMIKKMATLKWTLLMNIVLAWLITPLLAATISYIINYLFL